MSTVVTRARRVQLLGASARLRPSAAVVVVALVALALVAAAVSLLTGPVPLTAEEVWAALVGRATGDAELVVRGVRLPRVVAAVVGGAALGMGGALTQTVFRNDLASPDVIGVQSGAAVGAVLVITGTAGSPGQLTVAAFAGGMVLAAVMWALSSWGRRLRVEHVLVGVALAAMGEGVIAYLLRRADIDDLQRAAHWLAGDLTGVTPRQAWVLAAVTAALVVPLALLAPAWRQLQLGDELAVGLGARVGRVRTGCLVVAVGLVATATAIAGPVAFVALVAPHVGRRLAREPEPSLALAAAAGAALVSVADVVVRSVLDADVPVGIVTIAMGAPVLLALVVRGARP